MIDTSYPDHSMYHVEDHSNWLKFYSEAGEEIPKNLPPEKEAKSHNDCLCRCRSCT
jgi:hypothetical protein